MRTAKIEGREARWRGWAPSWLASHRPSRLSLPKPPGAPALAAPAKRQVARDDLKKRISSAAIAFRGYDVTNIGRSSELLEHPVYAPIVRSTLEAASALCSDAQGEKVDLIARVLAHEPSDLSTFVHDIGTVVAMQVAQMRILDEIIGIPVHQARLSFGHSIGELSALVLGGVYTLEQLLPVPLSLARDCADLTDQTTLGILSVHGATLQMEAVEHLCASISRRGQGLIGPSTYLSPYQVLLIGQYNTLNMLEQEMLDYLPEGVTLRRRPNHWPPLHTPLVWERNIPNRTAMAMHHTGGGDRKPSPTIVSCATGSAAYDEWNSRAILADWTDHPQRLWDVMEHSLASGAEIVIHVGPEPKLFPTGFERLSHRIMKQLKMKHLDRLGSSVIPSISRNSWLTRALPANAVLLRAPFLNHIILEDWLLAQEVS